jgi:hypothetical protein
VADLTNEIRNLAEHSLAEDLGLAVIRARITTVPVVSQIQHKGQQFPLVLVRRNPNFMINDVDERFLDVVELSIHTFAQDPDGDRDAGILADSCRVALRDAALKQFGSSTLGWVKKTSVLSSPRRVPDWATAQGPVQYADLPSNLWRYEGRYRLVVKRPANRPYPPSP